MAMQVEFGCFYSGSFLLYLKLMIWVESTDIEMYTGIISCDSPEWSLSVRDW